MGKFFKAMNKADQQEKEAVPEHQPPQTQPQQALQQQVQPQHAVQQETQREPRRKIQQDPPQETRQEVQREPEQTPQPRQTQPAVHQETAPPRKPARHRTQHAEQPLPVPEMKGGSDWDERLVLSTSITGFTAEHFRTLRTRILHPFNGKPPRSILITSATPGEGKSFVSANLGISFAQGIGQFSLVVDCDLRKPSLHNMFGRSNDRGLVDYLAGRSSLQDLIVKTDVRKLAMIPAGPPPINPAELLGSQAMGGLVNELVERYDDRVILLDSPPFQAASETAILANHVDGVVLVIRWGGSRREHVRSLVEVIGREKIIGIVFNAYKANVLDAKVFGYYPYGYGSRTGYGYGENRA